MRELDPSLQADPNQAGLLGGRERLDVDQLHARAGERRHPQERCRVGAGSAARRCTTSSCRSAGTGSAAP